MPCFHKELLTSHSFCQQLLICSEDSFLHSDSRHSPNFAHRNLVHDIAATSHISPVSMPPLDMNTLSMFLRQQFFMICVIVTHLALATIDIYCKSTYLLLFAHLPCICFPQELFNAVFAIVFLPQILHGSFCFYQVLQSDLHIRDNRL